MSAERKSRPEPVDGLLLLNKPAGHTSNRVLQRVKRLLRAKKAGHTGSLDPAATGMLPLCFGEATKVCSYLLGADKTYRVTARLGVATDTGDGDGKVTATAPVAVLSQEIWDTILQGFVGASTQIPPMYSALKKDGRRLYELARKGEHVEREARPIRIDKIELLEVAGERLVFRVVCSKGTYIRTLVEDIARKAGTVAHTSRLHREHVAGFEAAAMIDLVVAEALAENGPDALRDRLIPPDVALRGMPAVCVDTESATRFRAGRSVPASTAATGAMVRVYGPGDDRIFLGVGEYAGNGTVAPKRVFAGG